MCSVCLASKPLAVCVVCALQAKLSLHGFAQHGPTIQLVLHAPCFAAHSISCLRCIEQWIVLTLNTDVIVSSSGALELLSAR
jgi:hypothetical protein